MLRKILLATDGSAPSLKAADLALELAQKNNAEVEIFFVISSQHALNAYRGAPYPSDSSPQAEHWKQVATEMIKKTARVFEEQQVPYRSKIEAGNPADRICWEAESEGHDLVILGTRGQTGISRFLLGSVSSKVVAYAPCSVLVVR